MKYKFRIYVIIDNNPVLKKVAKTEIEATYETKKLIKQGYYSAYYEHNPIEIE